MYVLSTILLDVLFDIQRNTTLLRMVYGVFQLIKIC